MLKKFSQLWHASIFLVASLCCFLVGTAKAEVTNYGGFIHHSDAPNSLFLVSKIERNATFEFRKALRNHDIETVVLASPGGAVWEALSAAGIIFDRKINVIVPAGRKCASACAFLFFAGNQRIVNGELGVHQFSSLDNEPTVNTEAETQFAASEIIGFLNEFGTPPFVLERMFQQRDMYWFNEEELLILQTEQNPYFVGKVKEAEEVLSSIAARLEPNWASARPSQPNIERQPACKGFDLQGGYVLCDGVPLHGPYKAIVVLSKDLVVTGRCTLRRLGNDIREVSTGNIVTRITDGCVRPILGSRGVLDGSYVITRPLEHYDIKCRSGVSSPFCGQDAGVIYDRRFLNAQGEVTHRCVGRDYSGLFPLFFLQDC